MELAYQNDVRDVRTLGTILAFEIETGEADGYVNNLSGFLSRFFTERRIMLRPLGNTLYILPPYCTTDEQLAATYQSILDMLEEYGRQWAE